MILDNFYTLSGAVSAAGVLSGQSVTGTNTSVLSTNSVDLGPLLLGGNQPGDIGAGEPLDIMFSILAAPTVGTSVQFQLIQADDTVLSTNVQVINQTDAFPIASLPINTLVPLHWDRAAPYAPKRYIGARYVLVGAIASTSIFASLGKHPQDVKNLFFKSGYAVL
ncbi:hypothetical protein UFOVP5_56 [uncultured Caudovirales phage]|uniref:Uncharacterized protein n=1 Tax=uncultured Caudovirales phage TaxID=2100421 RepID=A0A6J5KKT5_9CAUD|nr:hypothetical protein UFOVP5_56 [uncultured Caudovirales phage]